MRQIAGQGWGWWTAWVLCALVVSGCRCGEGLAPVGGGFALGPPALDFGAALQGETQVREVRLTNLGRRGLVVTLEVASPFTVSPSVELAAGEERALEVGFLAGATRVEARLSATDGTAVQEVLLTAEGVAPLSCLPSQPCREARFDLASRACVESVTAEGSACTPTSLCLEKGVCVAGTCLGEPRRCDDANACTDDACAEGRGCVHTPRACPPSTRACHVATCHPSRGCGEAPAPELTPCGGISCASAELCIAGSCRVFAPAPDGIPCSPESPCREQGVCAAGACDIPESAPLVAAWSIPLPGTVEGPLRGLAPDVFVRTCEDDPDPTCTLRSFTGVATAGFERWATPLSAEASMGGLDEVGLCVGEGPLLASFDPASGVPAWSFEPQGFDGLPGGLEARVARGGEGRTAIGADGVRWTLVSWDEEGVPAPDPDPDGDPPLPEGPLQSLFALDPDGGVVAHALLADAGVESRVALSREGVLWLHAAEGRLARLTLGEEGFSAPEVWSVPPGAAGIAIAGERLVVGGRTLVDAVSGAVLGVLELPDPTGLLEEEAAPRVLLDGQTAYLLALPCAPDGAGACVPAASLSAYASRDGTLAWTASLQPPGVESTPVEAALLSSVLPLPVVGVLMSESRVAGAAEGWVRFLAAGHVVEECRLSGEGRPRWGLFQGPAMYAVVEREGGLRLEAYPLRGMRAEERGWPQVEGISGARRER